MNLKVEGFIDSVTFKPFTEAEVNDIAVVEVKKSELFDHLNNPVKNGLYDIRMGPISRRDKCGSCNLTVIECPGHYGKIVLPARLYHPVTFKNLVKLLRSSCTHCNKLVSSEIIKEELFVRYRLILSGKIDLLDVLERELSNLSVKDNDNYLVQPMREFYDKYVKHLHISEQDESETRADSEQFAQFQKNFFTNVLPRPKKLCPHCKMPTFQLREVRDGRLFQSTKLTAKAKEKLMKNKKGPKRVERTTARKKNQAKIFGTLISDDEEKNDNFSEWNSINDQNLNETNNKDLDETNNENWDLTNNQDWNDDKDENDNDENENDNDEEEEEEENSDDNSDGDDDNDKENEVDNRWKMIDELTNEEVEKFQLENDEAKEKIFYEKLENMKPGTKREIIASEAYLWLKQLLVEEWRILFTLFGYRRSERSKVSLKDWKNGVIDNILSLFFVKVLPVPPNKMRPTNVNNVRKSWITSNLSINLRGLLMAIEGLYAYRLQDGEEETLNNNRELEKRRERERQSNQMAERIDTIIETTLEKEKELEMNKGPENKIHEFFILIQKRLNAIYDMSPPQIALMKSTQIFEGNTILRKAKRADYAIGVRQQLEKKEGLFRKRLMGKRVNYSGRSVITPDPYLDIEQVGVPKSFALCLTFPEPVTVYNRDWLANLVRNGPEIHPGAKYVEFENGAVVALPANNPDFRETIANSLYENDSTYFKDCWKEGENERTKYKNKIVRRHLMNNDVVLMNRQPTLHRPSLMAHQVLILNTKNESLRFHYGNCKAYNADFDGDEMNLHFPQTQLARVEAAELLMSNKQYLVPKDGTPLTSLIQDYIVGGTLMTMKNCFFSKCQFYQLVYGALSKYTINRVIFIPPSCIIKPEELWSGKQVISTILMNMLGGDNPLTMTSKAKIPSNLWNRSGRYKRHFQFHHLDESDIIIRGSQLLNGVIDKAQCGASTHGLIHSVYELHGNQLANALLLALGKTFILYIQLFRGFTLGIEDILIEERMQAVRHGKLKNASDTAYTTLTDSDCGIEEQSEEFAKLLYRSASINKLGGVRDDELIEIDQKYKRHMNSRQTDLIREMDRNYLLKTFPDNNLQLMIQSGAKGAMINSVQMSMLLGQIELEGKRPPLTIEGRSLPSHGRYQLDSTAGGFIIGSFLTGITPQDFFFHCQAGREGLIDTAIKTSRSGYLQRSLVKHLEGLVVQYDYTVRDSDGSVIQFLYGEDSIDVLKSAFLNVNSFPFLIDNARVYLDSMFLINRLRLESPPDFNTIRHHWKCFHQLLQDQHLCYDEYDARILPFFHLNFLQLDTYDNFLLRIIDYDTLLERFRPTSSLDCISDKMDHMLNTYIEENEHAFRNSNMINPEDFLNLMKFKISNSFVEPGDAVGLLAAQSIGEPSTQMTLNTFHFAGRGEMNVTLGIPRLREILMVASANLKTPNMSVPVYNSYSAQLYARYLQKLSKRVTVCDMLTSLKMDRCVQTINGYLTTTYNMHLLFRPETEWDEVGYCGNSDQLFTYMTFFFLKYFIRAVKAKIHRIRRLGIFQSKDSRIVAGNELDQKEVIEEAHQMTKKPKMIHLDQMELTKLKEENLSEDDDDDDDYDLYSDSDFDDDDDADYLAKKAKKLDKNRRRKEVESANMKKLREKGGTKYTDEQLSITSNLDFVTKVKVVRGKNPDENSFFNFHLQIDNTNPFVDMFDLMKLIMSKAAVQQIPGIGQSFMKETERGLTFIAEGDDLKELMKYYSCFDFTRVHTNNIHVMAKFFGIEAANRVLIEEIFQVFAVYGIKVDHRHLSLIADYMTFHGVYKPLNRSGMQCCPSAIQRMTYEGTGQFLSSSLLRGESDFMQSPSSRLCTGRSVNVGTGLCACVNEVE